jgi:DNA-binding transcriptional LysR family regulator
MLFNSSDISSLNVFRTIVEHGSFVSAQYSLNISQSAVSQHMVKLEERLGFRLCHRGRAGFSLTEKGEEIYEHVRILFQRLDEFSDTVGEMRDELTGRLSVGISDNIISDPHLPLPLALNRFLARTRSVDVRLEVGVAADIEAKLLSGELSLTLTPAFSMDDRIVRRKVYDERQVLCCGNLHPLFGVSNLTLDRIEEHHFVVRPYRDTNELKVFQKAKVAASASNVEAIATLILSGCYLGYLPRSFAQRWLDSGQMRLLRENETSYDVSFYLATRKNARESLLLRTFMDELLARIYDAAPLASLRESD